MVVRRLTLQAKARQRAISAEKVNALLNRLEEGQKDLTGGEAEQKAVVAQENSD